MEKRKEAILNMIIKEHIRTGMPVGSFVIAGKSRMNISPATARNEMSELEAEEYIIQPHVSAGRVPTEKAYRFYLEKAGQADGSPSRKEKINLSDLEKILSERSEHSFKRAAKTMASLSGNAVFWAFYRHNLYYTGLANLFSQPEFYKMEAVHDISEIIDRMDEIVDRIFQKIGLGAKVLVGSENPFGNLCATVMAKYRLNEQTGLFGIIGPMRMDYERNIAIVNFVNEKLNDKV